MQFTIPMIWREQTIDYDDCYFCISKVSGYSKESKKGIGYPNLPSAKRPVLHGQALPVPTPPKTLSGTEWESKLSATSSRKDEM